MSKQKIELTGNNTILQISEIANIDLATINSFTDELMMNSYEGFEICTGDTRYYFLIDNYRQCYERIGHMTSEDNLIDFIGWDITNISLVDEALNLTVLENIKKFHFYYESVYAFFINVDVLHKLKNESATIQFVLYNNHNGWYGHHFQIIAVPISTDIKTILPEFVAFEQIL